MQNYNILYTNHLRDLRQLLNTNFIVVIIFFIILIFKILILINFLSL